MLAQSVPWVQSHLGSWQLPEPGVIVSHFRRDNLDVRAAEAGQAVERVVPADALVIATDDYGITSPMLLYFSHRKGWSFGLEELRPQTFDNLRRKGARFFATTVWSQVQARSPELVAYLKYYRQLDVPGPRDTVVFDIGEPVGSEKLEGRR